MSNVLAGVLVEGSLNKFLLISSHSTNQGLMIKQKCLNTSGEKSST